MYNSVYTPRKFLASYWLTGRVGLVPVLTLGTVRAAAFLTLAGLVSLMTLGQPASVHADSVSPTLSGSTVYGTTLTLTYDEALNENSVPDTTAIQVTVDDTERDVKGVLVENSEVILTLSLAVTSEQTVTVSYAVPTEAGASSIQDVASNAAPPFSGQAVPYADPCSSPEQSGSDNVEPSPVAVEVQAVPIVVDSTTEEYFVLYVSHELDGAEVEIPVSVTPGESGTTTLSENIPALPKERYRVEKYLFANPADVDGDCVDDITELEHMGRMNPVNGAPFIGPAHGAVGIPSDDMFTHLAWQSSGGITDINFALFGTDTGQPYLYFIDSYTPTNHTTFMSAIGLEATNVGVVTGGLSYHPELVSSDGSRGVYSYAFRRNLSSRSAEDLLTIHTVLAASIPALEDNLVLYLNNITLQYLQSQIPALRESRVPILFPDDLLADVDFLALNPGEGFGRLRVMEVEERPHPRDIVIYKALPNELPRVAGIISTVPQTPLAHVNLRAIQENVPNAFVRGALDDETLVLSQP